MRNKSLILILVLTILFLSGCQSEEKLQKEAEQTAQGFAIAWQRGEYVTAYDYFIPSLQAKRTASDFALFALSSESINKNNIIYDKIVLQDKTTAYAYYTIGSTKTNVEMIRVDGKWKINGFASYFEKTCVVDNCTIEIRKYLEAKFYDQNMNTCVTKYPYIAYTECQKYANDVITETLGTLIYSCDSSTKFICKVE